MKRFLSVLLTFALLSALSACGGETGKEPPAQDRQLAAGLPIDVQQQEPLQETPPEPFPGKIAIITNTVDCNEEEFRSAEQVIAKYGEDKIVHRTWPVNFMQEQEQMVTTVSKLAEDPEIKALIINQAVTGTNAAINKLLETRNDMFIAYCIPAENPSEVAARANLVLALDEIGMGPEMVRQAKKMGAAKFAHYSFPRHMSMAVHSARREEIIKTCAEEGLEFVDLTTPDPTSDVGVPGAQQYILEDVPKQIAKYGENTAFFATNCSMQIPLIAAVVKGHAIYPSPCCPSPYHGFTTALGIESMAEIDGELQMRDINGVIDEISRIADENKMGGRLSTWSRPVIMMSTNVAAEYAVKWLNGEVSKDDIDIEALLNCMADYAGVECFARAYVDTDGTGYPNFLMVREDYITFGENIE